MTWKIRISIKGSGMLHVRSSTEPQEFLVYNVVTGKYGRNRFVYTPIENDTEADTLGIVDWTRDDIILSWRPEKAPKRPAKTSSKKMGSSPKKEAKKATGHPRKKPAPFDLQDSLLQGRIIDTLQAGPSSEPGLAKAIGATFDAIYANVTTLLKSGIIKISGKPLGNNRAFRNRSRFSVVELSV